MADIGPLLAIIPKTAEFSDDDIFIMFNSLEGGLGNTDKDAAAALIKEHRPGLYEKLTTPQPPLYTPPSE